MAGKFEIYEDKGGEFRFRLKAGNGEIILASEGYKQKSSAENGIASVRENATDEARYELKAMTDGRCMFNLKAKNHQVIGTSQPYKSEASCKNGIDSVKSHAPDAKVEDLTAN